MPELAGNDTLFAFLSSLYQERSLCLVFNMASAAILGHNLEFESQEQTQNTMNTILSDLQSQS